MVRFAIVLSVALAGAAPAVAASKEESCNYQAQVVAAVQNARLNKVRERKVQAHVEANATWPAEYNTAIPLVAPWVYEMKMKDVRTQNLGQAWQELCLQQ